MPQPFLCTPLERCCLRLRLSHRLQTTHKAIDKVPFPPSRRCCGAQTRPVLLRRRLWHIGGDAGAALRGLREHRAEIQSATPLLAQLTSSAISTRLSGAAAVRLALGGELGGREYFLLGDGCEPRGSSAGEHAVRGGRPRCARHGAAVAGALGGSSSALPSCARKRSKVLENANFQNDRRCKRGTKGKRAPGRQKRALGHRSRILTE